VLRKGGNQYIGERRENRKGQKGGGKKGRKKGGKKEPGPIITRGTRRSGGTERVGGNVFYGRRHKKTKKKKCIEKSHQIPGKGGGRYTLKEKKSMPGGKGTAGRSGGNRAGRGWGEIGKSQSVVKLA